MSNSLSATDPKLELKSYIVNSIANALFFTIDPFINSIPAATSASCKSPENWNTMIAQYGFCKEARDTIATIKASGAFDNSAASITDIYAAYECENCSACCPGAAQISVSESAFVDQEAYKLLKANIVYSLRAIAKLQSAQSATETDILIANEISNASINAMLNAAKDLQAKIGTGTIGETIFVGMFVDEIINSRVLALIDTFIYDLGDNAIKAAVVNPPNVTAPIMAAASPNKLKSVESGRLAAAIKSKVEVGVEILAYTDSDVNPLPPKHKKNKNEGLSASWIAFIVVVICVVLIAVGASVYSWKERARSLRSEAPL